MCFPCSNNICPLGSAVRLYRVYDDVTDNYYLSPLVLTPGLPYIIIGAAYMNFDNDGDGLTLGMESLLGTSDNDADSDDDNLPDGLEYPAAGVPFSDPLISDIIFKDSFEN